MSFASTMGQGMCMGVPDVCNTPSPAGPIPIPYPNIGQLAMADPGTCAQKVFIVNKPAATTQTIITLSSGDEPGVAGGVVSGQNMGPVAFKVGSSVVSIEGNPAAYMGSMTGHNGNSNANMPAGSQIAPSQAVVTVSP
jgi:hypothetical protein